MSKQATAMQPVEEATPITLVSTEEWLDHLKAMYDLIARRAFEMFEGRGRAEGYDLEDWFRAESELLHPVHIDVAESDDALTLQAEVPGFSAKELEVNVEPRRVTISGKREAKEERKTRKMIYTERCADRILREINLPTDIETAKVRATLRDGVLQLAMPKAAPASKIKVEPHAT
jgi:HSP20 family protein